MHGIGGVPLSSMGGGALGTYAGKVLSTGPIAYWPLWETSGATAQCLVNSAQNGTYVNATVGSGTAPTGLACPWFDGAGDAVDVYSVTLAGAFNVSEGSLALWAKVNAIGVWTDGAVRMPASFGADAINNFVRFDKNAINNRLDYYYKANGVLEANTVTPITDTAWMHLVITWSVSNDRVCYYQNGASAGACDNTLGAWAGALAANLCVVGAQTNLGGFSFHGWISDAALWDRELALTTIQNLYVI